MNDDIEQRLSHLTPRGLRPDLRGQVLGAVASELDSESRVGQAQRSPTTSGDKTCRMPDSVSRQPPPSPWLRRAALAVAASLLLGIGLNLWASQASERRLAQLFGPPPVSKAAMEIAQDIEKSTDVQTGQWVYRQFTPPRQPGDGAAANAKYCDEIKRLINELQTVSKDTYHETPQKDSEMDRNRVGRIDGGAFDCQRRIRLDYRHTA